jgi:hypothetical protein
MALASPTALIIKNITLPIIDLVMQNYTAMG